MLEELEVSKLSSGPTSASAGTFLFVDRQRSGHIKRETHVKKETLKKLSFGEGS